MTDLDRYVAWLERRRRPLLIAVALLTALAAASLLRLRFDFDLLSQLPTSSAAFRDFRGFLEEFRGADELALLVRGDPRDLPAIADDLVRRLERLPEVGGVRHRLNVDRVHREVVAAHRWELLDDEGLAEVARRLEPAAITERVGGLRRALALPLAAGAGGAIARDPLGLDEVVGRALARAYADPTVRTTSDRLVSADGTAALLLVRPRAGAFDVVSGERLMDGVRAAEAETRAQFAERPFTVGATGGVAFALADKEKLRRDLLVYFFLAPVAIAAIFLAGFRDIRALGRALVPLAVVTPIDFALSLAIFGQLNMLSVASSAIFFGLGIDAAIYFLAALGERPATEPRRVAVAAVLREIGPANVVATLTSAASFLLIGASSFTGVAQLGFVSGLALVLNVPATFVLLPLLVLGEGSRIVTLPPPGRASEASARWLESRTGSRGYRLVVLVLLAAAAVAATRVRLDTDFMHLRPAGGTPAEVEAELTAAFGRLDAGGAVLVRGATLDEALAATERVGGRLDAYRAEGLVAGSSSLTSFAPSRATAERRRAAARALPRERAAGDLERALAASGFKPAPFARAVADLRGEGEAPFDAEALVAGPLAPIAEVHLRRGSEGVRLATFVAPAPGHGFDEVADRLTADLGEGFAVATGRAVVERELRRLLRHELFLFFAGAAGLNFFLLFLAERSVGRAFWLLSPTLAAVIATLGAMGVLGVAIDPVNVIMIPILLGLGVDHAVYFAAHLRRGERLAPAVARGLRVLALVSGTTLAGFASLALSSYPALAGLGLTATIALGLGALTTLAALPLFAASFARTAPDPGSLRPPGTVDTRSP